MHLVIRLRENSQGFLNLSLQELRNKNQSILILLFCLAFQCVFVKLTPIFLLRLVVLNLSDCKIGDPGFGELFSNIKENMHLRVLNLSSNNLTDMSAAKIKRVILYNSSLLEIYLHWNNIKSEGGAEVLSALAENSYLRVVDLSYNSLKHSRELTSKAAAYQLKQILAKDSSDLLHLDVSYNNFST